MLIFNRISFSHTGRALDKASGPRLVSRGKGGCSIRKGATMEVNTGVWTKGIKKMERDGVRVMSPRIRMRRLMNRNNSSFFHCCWRLL